MQGSIEGRLPGPLPMTSQQAELEAGDEEGESREGTYDETGDSGELAFVLDQADAAHDERSGGAEDDEEPCKGPGGAGSATAPDEAQKMSHPGQEGQLKPGHPDGRLHSFTPPASALRAIVLVLTHSMRPAKRALMRLTRSINISNPTP